MERLLKKACNYQGAALLIYKLVMTVAVTVTAMVFTMVHLFRQLPQLQNADDITDLVMDGLTRGLSSGWGYLVSIVIGTLVILLWKKPAFFRKEILKKGRPMGAGSFFTILCLFMGAQLASQLGLLVLDGVFGFFGKSMSAYMENAGINTDTFSMWLYVGLGAPIFEEILFRGLVMRSLEPYGKRLSILVSSLLFGFFHGNPVQAPYAALVGLVLGYVAMEYNILWAMVLHMFNNLIFADTFARLLQGVPLGMQNIIFYAVMVAFALAAILLLVCKRRQVVETIRRDLIQPWQYNGAFSSLVLLIFVGVCVFDMALFMFMVFLA